MRGRLGTIPTWASVLLMGLPFGVAMGISVTKDRGSTESAVVSGILLGLFFGLAMTIASNRQRPLLRQALGTNTSPALRRAATRAVRRGPVPADPEVRAAAIGLAEYQLNLLTGRRRLSLIIWPLVLAAIIASTLVFDDAPWPIALIAICLSLIADQILRPKYLRARIAVLKTG
ncbi:hypothetical protein GCM10009554_33630 [Kribbella koreensis]|uniref:Uncharacterized protein n=1 Tax=Kribbella koreensis TaxID=57909 RepID=A0ABP4AVR2_9ACTN